MPTTTLNEHIEVASVTTPTQRITKAKASLTDMQLNVYDRRTGARLLEVDGPPEQVNPDTWTYGDVTVSRSGGCGCGGTVIEEL